MKPFRMRMAVLISDLAMFSNSGVIYFSSNAVL
jgi:hypothetical protein